MRELNDLQRRFDGYVPQMLEARHSYAVLCPFVEQPDGLHLLFEVRAATLRRQPGEVCFPGGMQEPGETPEVCALRETWEEMGIPREEIRVFGKSDFLCSHRGFLLQPVLGRRVAGGLARCAPPLPRWRRSFPSRCPFSAGSSRRSTATNWSPPGRTSSHTEPWAFRRLTAGPGAL